jgi:hypothetical protein
MRWIVALAAIFGNLLLGGCAALPTDSKPPEAAYQALHAVDFAQTIQIARSPNCYHEADPLTKRLIGEHPSEGQVRAAWALTSTVHLAVTGWLDREVDATDSKAWRIARGTWHVLTIADAGREVVRNRSLGLMPFGGNACPRVPTPSPRIVDPPIGPTIGGSG